MEIILIENVDKLGSRGQIIKVADGYARNYLLPKKMAVQASSQGRKWVEQRRLKFLKLEAKEKAEAEELAQIMNGVVVGFTRKVGEHGNLFGSVTSLDIAEKLNSQGYNLDRRKIQLNNPIKVLGEYDVPVRIHRDVTATVKVKVEPEGGVQAAPAPDSATASTRTPGETPAQTEIESTAGSQPETAS
jgi:large subunit ribosomal protein L9